MKNTLKGYLNTGVFIALLLIPTVRSNACSFFELFGQPTVTKGEIEACFGDVRFASSSSGENLSRSAEAVDVLIHTTAFPQNMFFRGTLFLLVPREHRQPERHRYRDQLEALQEDLLRLLYLNGFQYIHAFDTYYEDDVVRSSVFINHFWEVAVSLEENNVRAEISTIYFTFERLRGLERALGNE